MTKLHVILLTLLLLPMVLQAQGIGSDSTIVPKDSSLVQQDSAARGKYDVDSIIYSSGKDSLIFQLDARKMYVYGKGNLRYKDTQLKSGEITVDFNTNMVEAIGGKADSVTKKQEDTPVLVDKGEEYKGSRMRYNYKTTRGYITFAQTKEQEANYSGAKIKKVDKTTFFVEKGIYTSCDAEHPHYYFYSSQMKVVQKEQLIGRWIWLAFGDVPFPIPLPFAVIPLQSGRRSGILPPAYGERAGYGKYFSRFGYFWAISDYMDVNLTATYYTRGGYELNSRYRYAKRYSYSGNLEGDFSNTHIGEVTDANRTEDRNWRLRWLHNQTITPTSRFDVNLEFVTNNYFNKNSVDYNQLLRNKIISNANYNKIWEESGSSLSASYQRVQELQSGDIYEVLPTLSFTKSQFYPFRGKYSIGDAWYELLGINYSGQFQNRRNKLNNHLDMRGGLSHALGFSIAPKVGYVTVTPQFSYNEYWYNKRIVRTAYAAFAGGDSVVTEDRHEINFVRMFNAGLSATTKFYGIFPVNTAGVAALRHTVQPSVSYSFRPDFSKPGWGYYDSYRSTDGGEVRYNKFEREIFGGAGAGETQSINLSVNNIFEGKTQADPRDTTSKESKFQLLNLSADVSYNFAADSLRLSDLRLGYRTQIGNWLSLFGGSNYSFYDYTATRNAINTFLSSAGKGFLRLTSFNFAASFTLSGERDGGSAADNSEEQIFPRENSTYQGLYNTAEPDFTMPWSISLNYNYSISKPTPLQQFKYSNISGSLNFNLTKNWKFNVTGSYDMQSKQFAAPQVQISRDLHCWLMNFTWNPIGQWTGYRLEIRVKASQLQDLKVTKTANSFSGR